MEHLPVLVWITISGIAKGFGTAVIFPDLCSGVMQFEY
jgi:hypothetical protein